MIKELRVKNFQAHADTTIEFGPVTTFIGENDEGKSTIAFKALKVALTGQNWDPKWLRDTPKQTTEGTIEAILDDGSVVHRTRTADGQIIRLTNAEGKTDRYTKIKGVEQFILQLTGLNKVTLDAQDGPEDLNFIRNGQRAFLIENDPDVVQRKVVGILQCNEIESAKIRLNKQLNKRKADRDYLMEENQRLVGRLESLIPKREEIHQVDDALSDAVDRREQVYYQAELLGELKEQSHLHIRTDAKVVLLRQLCELMLKAQQLQRQLKLLKELEIQEALIQAYGYQINRLKEMSAVIRSQKVQEEVLDLRELVDQLRQRVTDELIAGYEYLIDRGVCPLCHSTL